MPRYDHTPRYIGTIQFRASAEMPYRPRADLPPLPEGEILVDLLFEAHRYPFATHCRYVRFREDAPKHTFAEAVFSADPPGQRVGPWPGWRDIPPMPRAILRRGDAMSDVDFQFRGDEERSGELHALCTLPPDPAGSVTLESEHSALVPRSAELYVSSRQRALPVPLELNRELRGVHPRLLLVPSELEGLRARMPTSAAWKALVALLQSWDLSAELTPESKNPPGAERLRGEDRVLIGAILALVDPSEANLHRAREAYSDYLAQTASPDYEPLRIDTQSGETLFVLCVGYDWLHEQLSPAERARARQWLWSVADLCWSYIGYERRDYAQAHYLGCALGLVAFSFLFWDEHPRAKEWARYFAGVLDVVCDMLPADGFYPHGINLWIYEYGFLLRWLELYRLCARHDRWQGSEHWKHASRFRGSVTSPDKLLAVTFGDPQYRVSGDAWMHLLIGARTQDVGAVMLGQALRSISHEAVDFRAAPPRRRVYEFLYGEQEVDPDALAVPAIERFADGTQISIRSRDVLFCFRAGGPPLGWTRYRSGEYGAYGHSDPSHGAFLLLYQGHPVICGPGPVYRRETAHHACPTVDGVGQIGDTCVWLPDFFAPRLLPPVPKTMDDGSSVALTAQLAPAYLPASGIRSAERAIYVDPQRCIIGADRITCDRTRSIAWHLSSRYPIAAAKATAAFRLGPHDGPGVELAIVAPALGRWHAAQSAVVPGYTNDGEPLYTLTLTFEAADLEVLWCLSLDGRPASKYSLVAGPEWRIRGPEDFTLQRHAAWIYPEGFDAGQA